ncbi:MAG: peptidylprolyl isomerase [Planctomycetota bacterium]
MLLAGLGPPAAAQGEKEAAAPGQPPFLLVPQAAAPRLDGTVQAEEWAGAARFGARRKNLEFARCRILRAGRDLYLSLESEVNPYAINVRMAFFDPDAGRSIVVNLNPLNPPIPPLLLHRRRQDRTVERVSAAASEVRFGFEREGFRCELRLPLDDLEIGRSARDYLFHLQIWVLERQQCLAYFPRAANPALIRPGYIRLRPAGDWGLDEPLPAERPVQPALKLLEEIWREQEWIRLGRRGKAPEPVLSPYLGIEDGKRRDAPLRRVEEQLDRFWEQYPDYASVASHLMRVKVGRNDLAGAKAVLDALVERYPQLGAAGPVIHLRVRTLRDLGRYEEASALIERHWDQLRGWLPLGRDFRRELQALRKTWADEQEYRRQDAARDDLPRVLLETSRGDILLELFEDDAPNAVANFIALVEQKFYDGTRFHHVEGGRRVFGGDPNSRDPDPQNDGDGGPGYWIETEVGRRLHHPYSISFFDQARRRRTQGSIFMLCLVPMPEYDGVQTTFGRIVKGRDVVRALEYYDRLERAVVVRKRDHAYQPVKRQ